MARANSEDAAAPRHPCQLRHESCLEILARAYHLCRDVMPHAASGMPGAELGSI